MSRSISAWYRLGDEEHDIETPEERHYYLLGAQRPSMAFWSLPIMPRIGVVRLAQLAVLDPVCFSGWHDIAQLSLEIRALQEKAAEIDYDVSEKSRYIANLTYCYCRLVSTAPASSEPFFMIG